MSEKLSNQEILSQIAEMSDEERNLYGVTSDMQQAAAKAAGGNRAAAASFYQQFTPLYNAFVGFIVKFSLSQLSKATYDDVYAAHHRNMTEGRPKLCFVKPAKKGTGNSSAQFASNPATGGLTTVTTADMPDVVALYDIITQDYEARIPVSYEDVKTAFNNEYGINDLYTKVREGLEDAIIEGRNASYDEILDDVTDALIYVGSGSEIAANAGKATYALVPGYADWGTAADTGDFSQITDDQLTQVFVSIKNHLFQIMGRPETSHNALGEKNNKKDNLVCYVWSPLYAEMSRVKASAFNLDELLDRGVKMQPLNAPWLGKELDDGNVILCGLGSADFIRDYPTSDFASTVPTDRGVIECRFMTTEFAVAGYEPFTFLCGGAQSYAYKIKNFNTPSSTIRTNSYSALTGAGVMQNNLSISSSGPDDAYVWPAGMIIRLTRGTSSAGKYNMTTTFTLDDGSVYSRVDEVDVTNSTTANVIFGKELYAGLRAVGAPQPVTISQSFEAVT